MEVLLALGLCGAVLVAAVLYAKVERIKARANAQGKANKQLVEQEKEFRGKETIYIDQLDRTELLNKLNELREKGKRL